LAMVETRQGGSELGFRWQQSGNIFPVTLGWRCHPKGVTRGLPPRTQRLAARHLPLPWIAGFVPV
jgi:hypothetical protein